MTQELPFLDLAAPGFSTRGQEMRAARDAHWAAKTPYGLAVLRYREMGIILRDRRFRQGSHAWPHHIGLEGPFAEFWKRSLIGQVGEPHRLVKRQAMAALSQGFIDELTPKFERIAAQLTSGLPEDTQIEFTEAFAMPYAGRAICAFLNIDDAEWPEVGQDASTLGLAMGVDGARYAAEVDAAYLRLDARATELIARAERREDTSGYVARLVANGGIEGEILRDLVVLSIFGGVDTTRAQLGLGLELFIKFPEQWTLIRREPARVTDTVEEMIRQHPTTTWATREALEDLEFEGVDIARGTTLHLLVHAASCDPALGGPEDFDVTARRKKHFGFGGGAHHCLGAQMARCDIAVALRALSSRFASVDFAGEAEWLPDSGNTGPKYLPVTFAS